MKRIEARRKLRELGHAAVCVVSALALVVGLTPAAYAAPPT